MTNNEEMDYDHDAFEAWWHNEGSEPRKLDQTELDDEEFMQFKCKIAWLNGAYKARELQSKEIKPTCDTCVSYTNGNCDDHKGHYCIYGTSMEDRHIEK